MALFGTITRAIASELSEHGTNVAISHPKAHKLKVFTGNLNDQSEVHHKYGQVTTIEQTITNESQAKETISKAAETLGGFDMLIDLSPTENTYEPFVSIKGSKALAKQAFTFLEHRPHSRMIYVSNSSFIYGEKHPTDIIDLYRSFIKSNKSIKSIKSNKSNKSQEVTLNELELGVTEDYLRSRFSRY